MHIFESFTGHQTTKRKEQPSGNRQTTVMMKYADKLQNVCSLPVEEKPDPA
jgi:hypothetical protein